MISREVVRRCGILNAVRTLVTAALLTILASGCDQGQPAAETAATEAAVQPVAIDAVQIEQVPDDENAWLIFIKAATTAADSGVNSPAASNLEYPPYPPFSDAWHAMAGESEIAHVEAFRLGREARSLPRSMIVPELPASPEDLDLTVYNSMRHLANLLSDSAMHLDLVGNDAEAIERLLDLQHLARSMRAGPLLVSQLVALGIDALATYRAQVIGPGLRFDAAKAEHPATSQQVRRLIDVLLDDQPLEEQMRQTLFAEQALALSLGWRSADQPARLLPEADVELAEALITSAIEALETGNLPDALQRMTPIKPEYERLLTVHFRNLADRRMAAVSLAAQLYRADHGNWPENLDQLTPDYLSEVPQDPFRSDGGPIGYVVLEDALPDGSDRPLVYVDSGPAEDAIDSEPMYGWQSDPGIHQGKRRRAEFRQYRDLARWIPEKRRFDLMDGE